MDIGRGVAPVTLRAVGPEGGPATAQQDQGEEDEQRPDHECRDAARRPSRRTGGGRLRSGYPAVWRLLALSTRFIDASFVTLAHRCLRNLTLSHLYHPFRARSGRR